MVCDVAQTVASLCFTMCVFIGPDLDAFTGSWGSRLAFKEKPTKPNQTKLVPVPPPIGVSSDPYWGKKYSTGSGGLNASAALAVAVVLVKNGMGIIAIINYRYRGTKCITELIN